jgi:hypothetical protein
MLPQAKAAFCVSPNLIILFSFHEEAFISYLLKEYR